MAAPGFLERATPAVTALVLTAGALAVHGYHPYSEDGGVYLAGVEKLLDPQLFTSWPEFVTEHLRFSLFAPMTAALVRSTHLSLPAVLLLMYLLSTAALLLAAYQLAARLTASRAGRLGAMTLLACWLPLPIAGTSLLLADPYVTARSLTTPLLLFSLCFALDALYGHPRRWFACAALTACAAVLHPLMAAYGVAAILLTAACATQNGPRRLIRITGLAALALLTAALLQRFAPAESAAYLPLALTRYYWFPTQWHLYEQAGLLAPMIVLSLLLRRVQNAPAEATLLRAAIALAAISLLVALLFSVAGLPVHLVARLQPLRAFQTVYLVMIVALGAWAAERLRSLAPRRRAPLTVILLTLLAGVMFFVARDTYAHSNHVEWPGSAQANPWEQAFLWVRDNTCKGATVALDAHYITQGPGEDAQSFRALAQRSTPPDYSKDGGVASLDPALTAEWTAGERLTENLEHANDAERLRRMRLLGASWLILTAGSPTAWTCPYRNASVKVCRVP